MWRHKYFIAILLAALTMALLGGVALAGGSINTNGAGDITLQDAGSSASLDVSFAILQDGSVTSQAQGQWPGLPASALQPAIAATQPAPDPINHSFWYLSRTAGIVAYILLFLSVCLGLLLKSPFVSRVPGRWQVLDLHQFATLLVMVFTAIHVFVLLGDKYLGFTLKQLLLPVNEPYRPFWMVIGIIAAYAALAVTMSSYLRRFIPHRLWRLLHCSAFVLFFAVFLHSLKAGTDTNALWTQWMYIATGSIVVFLFLWRYQHSLFGWLEGGHRLVAGGRN